MVVCVCVCGLCVWVFVCGVCVCVCVCGGGLYVGVCGRVGDCVVLVWRGVYVV